MDWDDRVILDNNVSFLSWIRKYEEAREEQLTDWVSTFHQDHLPCKLATHKRDDSRGAFNINCKVEFSNGEKWMVRFPMVGKVINADEKIEIEVATMNLIRQRTAIPIPEVRTWGRAGSNPLGIGPFMMMDFVEGVGVDDILQNPDARMMREDLRKLDFPRIGSLTTESTIGEKSLAPEIHSRPLTKKAHDFLVDGGVDVLGPSNKTFSSTTDYFHHIVDKDLQHLHEQPNSVDDAQDARENSRQGPFKLTCDDFQPTNMIVNNTEDLKIIAVLDWEWSYTAPLQLVSSTPTWLIIESPNAWGSVDQRLARGGSKDMEAIPEDHRPSTLLSACQEDGHQWFHFILLRGFNGPTCVPFIKLREETEDWDELVAAIPEDINDFVQKKMADLQEYEKKLAEMKERYSVALAGGLEGLDLFLRNNSEVLSLDSQRYLWQS